MFTAPCYIYCIKERKQTMKKVLLTLLAAIVVLGAFTAVGYTGYRFGYAQSVRTTAAGDSTPPELRPFDQSRPHGMPMHNFDGRSARGFDRSFGPDGSHMRGFGFFSLLIFLVPIVVLALIVMFAYWLFTRSGWQLTRRTQVIETQPTPTEVETEAEG